LKVINNNLSIINKKHLVATIGYFDGIHYGHKKILKSIVEDAKKNNGISMVITFWPHPRIVLGKSKKIELLSTMKEKEKILEKIGINLLYIIKFTRDFSKITAKDFITNFLSKKLKIDKLVIGYNHNFGNNREGNYKYLRENKKLYKFKIQEISKQQINKKIEISSSLIRENLIKGNIKKASEMLGYNYFLHGKVIKGDGIGSKINYPTANIDIEESKKLIPKDGVYAVIIEIKKIKYLGMLNVGYRPTVNGKDKRFEVHIFDFNSNIYNQKVKIEFVEKIREEKKFENLKELKNQLEKDKIQSIKIINRK
jgi:riboflavin kinase/FMN adenylyltransferase|tara:strand:- start:784 stop:1716 length:933 start_codon:yes stop_codon:yes gene_type:complete